MKFSPQILIAVLAVFAVSVLALFYIQTSPNVTDQKPEPVVVENVETSENKQPEAKVEEADPEPEIDNQEANLNVDDQTDEIGINLARVRPDGSALIAGKASPGSIINLIKDGEIIGTAVASDQGEWVIIPDMLFDQGSHLVSVEIINPDGTKQIGEMALAIEILDADQTPLVALVPYTEEAVQSATVLQAPEAIIPENLANEIAEDESNKADDSAEADIKAIIPRVTIRSIQALNERSLTISGLARSGEMGSSVDISVNGAFAVTSRPDDQSLYSAAFSVDPNAAPYELKSVLRDANGKAIASARIKLSQAQMAEGFDGNALIVVQKGDALWRIAYKTYGAGIRYVDIVRQNATKINDPDLIYPDQIFIIPNGDQ